jgi:hypothetical protein
MHWVVEVHRQQNAGANNDDQVAERKLLLVAVATLSLAKGTGEDGGLAACCSLYENGAYGGQGTYIGVQF